MTALSSSNEYRTPARIFRPLHQRYRYTLDVAAAAWNAQLPRYFTKEMDALKRRWPGRWWGNFPYSKGNLPAFVPYGRDQVLEGYSELGSCLVPHSTSDGWWHDVVEAPAGRLIRLDLRHTAMGIEHTTYWRDLIVRKLILRGRVSYTEQHAGKLDSARHHSVVVTFIHPRWSEHRS